ncbi:MAG TPA: Hsp20/alpha crystallin family protein [Candidatus Ozemobacteraceae bacterium]|mgnify:CR=1 FL=1|nr:Hsp20/alpha crystallin family protein [Candidatus Ozemobacteraceae bacterium]
MLRACLRWRVWMLVAVAGCLVPFSLWAADKEGLEEMMRSMDQKMDQMMQTPFGGHGGEMPRWLNDPADVFPMRRAKSNITEKGDSLVVTIDLPGHDKNSINLRIKDQTLILKSERKSVNKEDKDNKVLREEISYGSFSQMFELPRKVLETQAKAIYADGVLTVTLPIDKAAPAEDDGFKVPVN